MTGWWGDNKRVGGLRRTALLRRVPLKRKTWIQPVSHKRSADRERRLAVRTAVYERDHHQCQIAPLVGNRCFGPLTPHHLKKASAGGEYTENNLIAACALHNQWVEDHPTLAKSLGLVA